MNDPNWLTIDHPDGGLIDYWRQALVSCAQGYGPKGFRVTLDFANGAQVVRWEQEADGLLLWAGRPVRAVPPRLQRQGTALLWEQSGCDDGLMA